MGQMLFLSPDQQCQSTKENTLHKSQPVAWPHSCFILHHISIGRGDAAITPAILLQYPQNSVRFSSSEILKSVHMPTCHTQDSEI